MSFPEICAYLRRVRKVAKHIEACKAQVVFLSESCNEATYKKLIQAGQG